MPPPPSETGPIRLLLVEDHSQVAMALGAAFETVPDIELVGQARAVHEAVSATGEHQPDVVLLDRRLPDGDGIEAIGRLREQCPAARVLVFTGGADRSVADRVAAAGGAGLLLKAGLLEDLLDTIRRVAAGEDSFDVDLPGRPSRR
ncbi:response regulator transcription factor [Amycolatopsis acidiphila]|uniref:response regulator n=1 Tax=Amycolatopsis acidiphila TaxID=715473 RepID=UPI00164375E9|nr:response regulator transcription factor [Amycolatopsis acidiphila]UIJ63490.1 response regulator transcription factor [Amycolatopsis acidiphila]